MKNRFIDFFSLSSAERRGVIVLLLLIMILSVIQVYVTFHGRRVASFNDSTFFREVSSDDSYAGTSDDSSEHKGYEAFAVSETYELFAFDPNTISAGDLRRLGISSRLTRTWLNYRLHGGRFRVASDINKLYGMTGEIYKRLLPYINIEQRIPEYGSSFPVADKPVKTDINRTDSAGLIKVRGIGPVLSGRIVRYRNLLGGFYSTGQLLEVYGFPDSLLEEADRWFFADTAGVQKININNAAEDVLRKHPYIGRYNATGIIKYRSNIRRISDLEELKINGIFNEEQFEKVKKYLDI